MKYSTLFLGLALSLSAHGETIRPELVCSPTVKGGYRVQINAHVTAPGAIRTTYSATAAIGPVREPRILFMGPVKRVVSPRVGAPLSFEAKGFSLTVNFTVSPRPDRTFAGSARVTDKLGTIRTQAVTCRR